MAWIILPLDSWPFVQLHVEDVSHLLLPWFCTSRSSVVGASEVLISSGYNFNNGDGLFVLVLVRMYAALTTPSLSVISSSITARCQVKRGPSS